MPATSTLLTAALDRLLAPHVSSEDALKFATGCLFLAEVEHKHEWNSLIDSTPKAVSQAVALLKSTKCVELLLPSALFFELFITSVLLKSVSASLMASSGFSLF